MDDRCTRILICVRVGWHKTISFISWATILPEFIFLKKTINPWAVQYMWLQFRSIVVGYLIYSLGKIRRKPLNAIQQFAHTGRRTQVYIGCIKHQLQFWFFMAYILKDFLIIYLIWRPIDECSKYFTRYSSPHRCFVQSISIDVAFHPSTHRILFTIHILSSMPLP